MCRISDKNSVISHAQYMEALEKKDVAKYPGFSNHPVKAFKHLASDLSLYGELFLKGNEEDFIKFIDDFKQKPKKSGFAALSDKKT